MKREYKQQIVDLLNSHRIMTIATNRGGRLAAGDRGRLRQ